MRHIIRALIFDVDETLVYYEGYNLKEWFRRYTAPAIKRLGIEIDAETYRKMTRGELPRSYVERFGVSHVLFWKTVDGANLKYRIEAAERGKIKPFPDVDALKELKDMGLKLAAVSNASQECTEFVLDLFKLRRYFDAVFGKDYSYLDGAKPSPYLIEKSLKTLKISPEEALVVGDSKSDVLAAHRAGVKAVQIVRFEKVENADYYVKTLWQLLELVESLNSDQPEPSGISSKLPL